MANGPNEAWHKQKKGEVHQALIDQARRIEWQQSATFDRFYQLECLYDPELNRSQAQGKLGVIDENVVATNVDTVAAVVATTEVRPRVQTDGADWHTQRTARELELYGEGLLKEFEVHPKCAGGFKEAAKKGTAVNFVLARNGKPCVEPTLIDNVLVDDHETENGEPPRTLYRISRAVPKDELIAEYPKLEKQISDARSTNDTQRRVTPTLNGTRTDADEVVVVESWRLKVGKTPGRYVKCIGGADLEDKPYNKPYFPCARIVWSERRRSFYGISLAERIAGHQRALNRRNWHIQRILDRTVAPPTYVRPADAGLRVQSINDIGTVAVVRGDMPVTITAPQVNPEIYKSREDLRASAGEESGVSRMAAYATKPPGIESGVAMREFRDITTQRFATQEKAYEMFVLDTLWLLFEVCKELGAAAPKIQRRSRFGARTIQWQDVDLGDIRIQLAAASTLSRTPAGRQQTVIEWAQAGVISMDEARRLLRHPDLERSMSLYTSAVESCEADLDEIARGKTVVPEPFSNHKMCVWRGQAQFNLWARDGAPESVLEDLRQYIVTAAWYVDQAGAANAANANAAAGAAMAQPGMPTGPADMPMPIAGAPGDPGVAALAPEAMNLRAV